MRTLWKTSVLMGCLLACHAAMGIVLPLEVRQNLTTYNLQSRRGVPISAVTNNPPGSDGRMPTGLNGSGSYNVPTTNQYRSFIAFGGAPGLIHKDMLTVSNSAMLRAGKTPFTRTVAAEMKLPVGKSNNVITMILRRAQVGTPYLSRQISFSFGSIVDVPDTDEKGILLTNVSSDAY